MPKLIIENGPGKGKAFSFQGNLSVGSAPDCNIKVKSQTISARHFLITKGTDGFYLVDLGSKQGTFLNGQNVVLARLYSNDVIKAGPFTIKYVEEEGLFPEASGTEARFITLESLSNKPAEEEIPLPPPLPVESKKKKGILGLVAMVMAVVLWLVFLSSIFFGAKLTGIYFAENAIQFNENKKKHLKRDTEQKSVPKTQESSTSESKQ